MTELQSGTRLQSSLGTKLTRADGKYKVDTLIIARVASINYQLNTVTFTPMSGSIRAQNASQGGNNAVLPMSFAGRNGYGRSYGEVEPIVVGDIILVGYVDSSNTNPIVIGRYPDAAIAKEVTAQRSPSYAPDDVDTYAQSHRKLTVYPDQTYSLHDGSGRMELTFSGNSFVLVNQETNVSSHATDDGDMPVNETNLAGHFDGAWEERTPLDRHAPEIVLRHNGTLDKDGNKDQHELYLYISQDGTYRTSIMNDDQDWRSYFEMTPDGKIRLRRQEDSKIFNSGSKSSELLIDENGYVTVRSQSSGLVIRPDGIYNLDGTKFTSDIDLSNNADFKKVWDSIDETKDGIKENKAQIEISSHEIATKVSTDELPAAINNQLKPYDDSLKSLKDSYTDVQKTIDNIASDGVISGADKKATRTIWLQIQTEYPATIAQAEANHVDHTALDDAYTTLKSYLTPILLASGDTTIDSTEWDRDFSNYYNASYNVNTAIVAALRKLAQAGYDKAVTAAEDAGDAITQASEATSEDYLTGSDKATLGHVWIQIQNQYPNDVSSADAVKVDHSALDSAYNDLNAYIQTNNIFANNSTIPIDGETLANKIKAYFKQEASVLKQVADKNIQTLAEYGQDIDHQATSIKETSTKIALSAENIQKHNDSLAVMKGQLNVMANQISGGVSETDVTGIVNDSLSGTGLGHTNQFVLKTATKGQYMNGNNGSSSASTNGIISDYVAVNAGTPYSAKVYGATGTVKLSVAWYDSSKSFISGTEQAGTGDVTNNETAPTNASYAKVSTDDYNFNTLFIAGNAPSEWAPSYADAKGNVNSANQLLKSLTDEQASVSASINANGNKKKTNLYNIGSMFVNGKLGSTDIGSLNGILKDISSDHSSDNSLATQYEVDISALNNYYEQLKDDINGLLGQAEGSSVDIDSYRAKLTDYYTNRDTFLKVVKGKIDSQVSSAKQALSDANNTANEVITNKYANFAITVDGISTKVGEVSETANNAKDAANTAASAASAAESAASAAQADANATQSSLDSLTDDGNISPIEKQTLAKDYAVIKSNKTVDLAQATKYSVDATAYTNAESAVETLVNPILADMTTNTSVDRGSYKATFSTYYTARTSLLNVVADIAKNAADKAQNDVDDLKTTTTQKFSKIEQTAGEIKQTVSEVTTTANNASDKINNLQVGGTNLLPNTIDFSSWQMSSRVSIDSTIYPEVAHYPSFTAGSADIDFLQYASLTSLVANTTYTFSFSAKGSGNLNVLIYPNVVASDSTDNVHQYALTSTYQKYNFTFTTSSNISGTKNVLFRNSKGNTLEAYITQVKLEQGNVATDWSPAPNDGLGIKSTTIMYQLGDSDTTPPDGTWSEAVPTLVKGMYLWTRTTLIYTDNSSESIYSVTYIAKDGRDGKDGVAGKDGIAGKDGVGIKSTQIMYAQSTSGTTAPTTGWTAQVPTLIKGQYLWTQTTWVYSDNTGEAGYTVSYNAKDGNTGKDGIAGKDGVGIKSTTITYQASTSGTTAPTGTWVTNPPSVAGGNYLWTRTVWTYTDNTTETGYSVAKMGEKGDTGDHGLQGLQGPKGDQGIQGPVGKSSYTHIAYGTSSTGAGFTQTPSGSTTYIGMYVDNVEDDSTDPTKYAWSLIKGADGADGKDGVPGKAGADGRTPYFHIAYADSSNGNTNFSLDTPGSRKYIGQYTDFTQADSTNPASYKWQLVQGPKGDTGKDGVAGKPGVGIKSTAVTYQASTSGTTAPTGTWVASPTATAGQYQWTRTVWTYTDGTTETGYSVGHIGANGANGKDGVAGKPGVGIKSTTITYQDGTSGTVKPTGTWVTNPPSVAGGNYLWTRTVWTYTDNTTETGYSVAKAGEKGDKGNKGDSGTDGLPGKDGVGIKSTAVTYQVSTSGTTAPTGTWLTVPPTVAAGNFLWTRMIWTYTDGTTETGYSVGHIGADGSDGLPGKAGADGRTPYFHMAWATADGGTSGFSTTDSAGKSYLGVYTDYNKTDSTNPSAYTWSLTKGADGKDGTDGVAGKPGVGIKSTTITYASSTSGTSAPTSGWVSTPPTATAGQFVWTRTVWNYTDGTTEIGYSVGHIGANGASGKDGVAGKPGVGIKSTTITYQSGTSGTVKPTGTWVANPPSVTGGSYLWTRTVWTYTDGTSETGYSVAKMGEKGDKGDRGLQGLQGPRGDQGIQGPVGKSSYTHIAYGTSSTGAGFTQTPSASTKYIGMYVDNVATDSTSASAYKWTLIKGADGAQGTPGKAGSDGKTPYFHQAWADSPDGKTNFSTTASLGKKYLGTYTDYVSADSKDPKKYKWTELVGAIEIGGTNLLTGTAGPFKMGYGIPNTTWNTNTLVSEIALPTTVSHDEVLPNGAFTYPCTPGVTYTQSVYISTDAPLTGTPISFTWFAGGYGHNTNGKDNLVNISSNIYRATSTYTWPSNQSKSTVRFIDLMNLTKVFNFTKGTFLNFYKPKAEQGNTVTDWSPAPEDNASASDLSKTNQKVSTVVTQTAKNWSVLSQGLGGKSSGINVSSDGTVSITGDHVTIASDLIAKDIKGKNITGSTFANDTGTFSIDKVGNIKGASISGSVIELANIDTTENTKKGSLISNGLLFTLDWKTAKTGADIVQTNSSVDWEGQSLTATHKDGSYDYIGTGVGSGIPQLSASRFNSQGKLNSYVTFNPDGISVNRVDSSGNTTGGVLTPDQIAQLSNVGKLLWSGTLVMNNVQTVTPSLPIDQCLNGWMLMWSQASNGSSVDSRFIYQPILKSFVVNHSGQGLTFPIAAPADGNTPWGNNVAKYIYANTTTIYGYSSNNKGASFNYGLREVRAF